MADTTTSSGILSRQELEDVLEGLENQAGALEDEIHLIGEVFLRKVTQHIVTNYILTCFYHG